MDKGLQIEFGSTFTYLKLDQIQPNPKNPRKNFSPEAMAELVTSIQQVGVLQPVVVVVDKPGEEGEYPESYRLVAGERRWKAAREAGLEYIPAAVRQLTPQQELEVMIIENLHRKDIDAIEEAQGFKTLLESGYTQEALGEKLGISQAHISNRLRLLELPEKIQENISRGIISASHGKVLAGHKKLPEEVLERAAASIAENNIPVSQANLLMYQAVAKEGLPLFDTWNNKPLFKLGPCEECVCRFMGKQWEHDRELPYCMNKPCWEAKQAEAVQKQFERAQKTGKDFVDLGKLNYNQFEYWREGSRDYDQSGCLECEKHKLGKRQDQKLSDASMVCLDPGCMRKKQAARTREENKKKNDAFKAELAQIEEMVVNVGQARNYTFDENGMVTLDKVALIYIAGQILGSVDTWHDRKITLYQYLKGKFGWDLDVIKRGSWGLLRDEWETFRRLLEQLSETDLLWIIIEWPAVARDWKVLKDGS